MAAESVRVDLGLGVHVHSTRDQPTGNFNLVEIDAEVQQRRARQGRAVQPKRMVGATANLGWIDFLVGEGASQQMRVASEMGVEQVDAAAVYGHCRRGGEMGGPPGGGFRTLQVCPWA